MSFILSPKQDNANPPLETEIMVCNAMLYYENGTSRPLRSNKIKVKFTSIVNQENIETSEVILYPNPAKDNLFIQGINGKYSATLLTIEGTTVRKFNQFSSQEQFSLEGIEAGIYFLSIEQDGRKIVKKLVIEK